MIHPNIEASVKACINNDLKSLQQLIPSCLSPDSRVEKLRIKDKPFSYVPFLCVAIAYGSIECFEYLIEEGATTYFADLIPFFLIIV